jgi:high-affinity iron transporter
MLSSAIIVFREVLEAALIIGIVLAATRGLPRRLSWVSAGVLGGVAGAVVVAASADVIAVAASGVGQELLNAGVLLGAVLMIGWHNVWMQQHGRELAARMGSLGHAVRAGERPLYALAIVVGLAVLREGAEVVLFLNGIVAADGGSASTLLAGGVLGLAAGALAGATAYFGLLRIPLRHLFGVTGWLLLLLAAGMAAQAASYLEQAGYLPALGRSLWNSSWLLSEQSIVGQVLHTLVGYVARPDGIQVLFYLLTGGLMALLMFRIGRQRPAASAAA